MKKTIKDDREWFKKMYHAILAVENDQKKLIAILHDIFDDGYALGYNTAQLELEMFHKKLEEE